MMSPRFIFIATIFFSFLCCTTAFSQTKADHLAVKELVKQYGETEDAGDMVAQAKLMTADRVWIGGGGLGRMTDQARNMEVQQAQIDSWDAFIPNVKWYTDARDLLVNFYADGEAAVASFYWYRTFVLPADTPMEKASVAQAPDPTIVTLVLVKDGGSWKIAHTHVSPMHP